MEDWVSQVVKLADFAMSQPQACYTAFTFGLRHRWTYLLRTLPDIEDLVEPLERAIADVLIPSITDHHCTAPSEREHLALPVRLGGLGIINQSQDADLQYQASTKTTAPLVHETPNDAVVSALEQSVRRENIEVLRAKLNEIENSLTLKTQRVVELVSEKGSSNWLTVIGLHSEQGRVSRRFDAQT